MGQNNRANGINHIEISLRLNLTYVKAASDAF